MSDQSTNSAFNLGSVIDDAKKVITSPISFYKEMSKTGGYAEPLIFAIVMAVITGLILAVFSLIGFSSTMAGAAALGAIIFMPIAAVLGSFIGGAILFVIWKLMGSQQNYQVAVRCIAYSFAIMPVISIISFIPYIGSIIQTLWVSYLMYIASVQVHDIKESLAKIVFGILAALGVIIGVTGERASRNLENHFEEMTKNLPNADVYKNLENIEDMTPEEAGEQFGKFLKGMEEFQKGLEKSVQENQTEN